MVQIQPHHIWRRGATLTAVGLSAMLLLASTALAAGPAAATLHATWMRLTPGIAPPPRSSAGMAYDAGTREVVLFGGYGPGLLGDTWTWDGAAWTQRTPAHVPPPRTNQQMAYDQQSGQLLMFGGSAILSGQLADTWVWNGSDWVQLQPSVSPPNRDSAAFAYDPATRQIVMFGGIEKVYHPNGFAIRNDTWTWSGTTWTPQHPAVNPPATVGASMAYDPSIGRLVLFGGRGVAGDTWTWDGSNWTKLASPTSPSARFDAPLALDPASGDVILSGGASTTAAGLSDTWALDGAWTQLHPGASAPTVSGAGIATDPGTGHLVLFGGATPGTDVSNQTWVWGPLTITPAPVAPAAVGLRYSRTLQSTGATGASHWRLSSGALPAGLSLSTGGVISGTPTVAGSSSFTVTVTDSATPAQSASRAFTLTVGRGPTPGVYVADGADSQIHAYGLGANGNAAPTLTLGGPLTTLNGPAALLFDQSGQLAVANSNTDTVAFFAPGSSGNLKPQSVLGGSVTGLHSPYGLAQDAEGDLLVADRTANAITVYAPGAGGDARPIRTLAGPDTLLSSPQAVALDGAGHLWVANTPTNTVTEYPSTANGDIAPIAVITGQSGPQGLAEDRAGNLLVASTYAEAIRAFSSDSTSPSAFLAGPATQLSFPIGIDVDAGGRLYVANQYGGVNVYAADAAGNATPLAVIAGPATGLSAPGPLAVTPPLYVITRSLPHASAGRRYRARLYAGLGQTPLHWRIVRGRLPRGLSLTRTGEILGTPRHMGVARFTIEVTDSTRPRMQAHRALRLTVGWGDACFSCEQKRRTG
jgi:hypothetical protein